MRSRSRSAGPSTRMKSDDANMVSQFIVPRGGLSSKTFTFTRWCDGATIYNTTDGTAGGAIVTAGSPDIVSQHIAYLGLLPNSSEFTDLFSQFKILQLEYHIINAIATDLAGYQPTSIQSFTAPKNSAVYLGKQNDLLTPSTIAQCQQESGVVLRTFYNEGKPFIIKIKKPTNHGTVVNANNSVVVATNSTDWLDTQTATIIGYRGMFFALDDAFSVTNAANTVVPVFTVRIKLTVAFKGVR